MKYHSEKALQRNINWAEIFLKDSKGGEVNQKGANVANLETV